LSDTYTDSDSDGNINAYTDSDGDINPYTDANGDACTVMPAELDASALYYATTGIPRCRLDVLP
jgi:hypothetical protein